MVLFDPVRTELKRYFGFWQFAPIVRFPPTGCARPDNGRWCGIDRLSGATLAHQMSGWFLPIIYGLLKTSGVQAPRALVLLLTSNALPPYNFSFSNLDFSRTWVSSM
jgi:hypothetical protein